MSIRPFVVTATLVAAALAAHPAAAQTSTVGSGRGVVHTGEAEDAMGCIIIYPCPFPPPIVPPGDGSGDDGGGSKPSDPAPPKRPGGASTGPQPPVPPATGRPRGAVTGGRHAPSEGLERWEAWWGMNEPRFLVRARERSAGVTSRSSGGRTGWERVTSEFVRAQILPPLLLALGDPAPDVEAAAALALARATPQSDVALMRRALARRADAQDRSLRRVATLSLGLLGDAESFDDLAARAGAKDSDRVARAYAAAGLGLLGDARAVAPLQALLHDETLAGDRGAEQAAVLALGLVRGDETQRAALLQALLRDPAASTAVRVQAPIALARLAATPAGRASARAALPLLAGELAAAKCDVALRRSIVVALPRLADPDDVEAIDALLAAAGGAADVALRHLAIIALGEVAGADRDALRHAAARARIATFLTAEAADEHDVLRRPFAALALGLLARNPELATEERGRAVTRLLDGLETARNPSVRGAFAIALGISGDALAAGPLAAAFEGASEPSLVGHLALAIGLTGDRSCGPRLRDRLLEKGHDAALARDLALGVALLHDPTAVATFIERMREGETLAEIAAAAHALALLGDRSAVAPLVELARDPSMPSLRRGLAIASLGVLGQRDDLAFPMTFRAETNYLDLSPVMAQLASIL
jgi:HEAT repeat protein